MLTADDFRESKLRGFMFTVAGPNVRPAPSFFADAEACGANIGRTFVPLSRSGDSYVIMPGTFETIDFLLQNVKFPLVLCASAPGINEGQDFWTKPALQNSLISIWTQIADRYKNSEMVGGYDLLNEPVYQFRVTSNGWAVWTPIAQRMYDAIRKVDPWHVIVVSSTPGGIPSSYFYFESCRPIVGSNIVYTLHMYEPYTITHCGIGPYPLSPSLYYPGGDVPNLWPAGPLDKSWLEKILFYPRRWATAYSMPMFVGEFSCVRWAPRRSRDAYLRDNINLFNEYGWSWAYLTWRAWPGWDAENDSTSTVVDDSIYNPYCVPITMLRRAFSAQYVGKEL